MRNKKTIIGMSIAIIAVLVLIPFFTSSTKDTNNNDNEKVEEYVIPEDRKALVTFFDENGNTYEEEREVDRSLFFEYISKLNNIVLKETVKNDWGIMDKNGSFYYVEYDYLEKTHNQYGVIMYYKLVEINYYKQFQILGAVLDTTTINFFGDSSFYNIRQQNISQYGAGAVDMTSIKQQYIYEDLKKLLPDTPTNIKIGIINIGNNPWIEAMTNNSTEENENTNVDENSNQQEKNTNVETSNSVNNNVYNNYANNTDTSSNNNNASTENKPSPVVSIDTGSGLTSKYENYTLQYSISNVYEDTQVIIKQNNKVISENTITNNDTLNQNVVLIEGSNKFEIIATNASGKSHNQTIAVTYNITAPRVSIDTSSSTVVRNDNQYNFSYSYYDDYTTKPVDVIIKLNGTTVKERKNITSPPSETIYLNDGENIIEVIVTNYKGKSGSATKKVTYTP